MNKPTVRYKRTTLPRSPFIWGPLPKPDWPPGRPAMRSRLHRSIGRTAPESEHSPSAMRPEKSLPDASAFSVVMVRVNQPESVFRRLPFEARIRDASFLASHQIKQTDSASLEESSLAASCFGRRERFDTASGVAAPVGPIVPMRQRGWRRVSPCLSPACETLRYSSVELVH